MSTNSLQQHRSVYPYCLLVVLSCAAMLSRFMITSLQDLWQTWTLHVICGALMWVYRVSCHAVQVALPVYPEAVLDLPMPAFERLCQSHACQNCSQLLQLELCTTKAGYPWLQRPFWQGLRLLYLKAELLDTHSGCDPCLKVLPTCSHYSLVYSLAVELVDNRLDWCAGSVQLLAV